MIEEFTNVTKIGQMGDSKEIAESYFNELVSPSGTSFVCSSAAPSIKLGTVVEAGDKGVNLVPGDLLLWDTKTMKQQVKYQGLPTSEKCPIFLMYGRGGADKSMNLLVALLLGVAMMVINRCRQRAEEGLVVPDCLTLFRGYVRARASLEREHTVLT
eukprot:g34293.t1